MKLRNGFVSNSSSSSFIIGVKDKLTKDTLESNFGVPKDSVGWKFIGPIIEFLIKEADEITIKSLVKDEYCKSLEEFKENYPNHEGMKLLEDGWKVYEVRVSNEDYDGISQYFYENGCPEVNTEDLVIKELY